MSGIHAAGYSDNLFYDDCAYNQRLKENREFAQYQLYQGAYENIGKCKYDRFYHPYDLVDVESELKNQTRPLSDCPSLKYMGVKQTGTCSTKNKPYQVDYLHNHNYKSINVPTTNCSINGTLGTFNKTVPVVYPPELCPIVYNNIPKRSCPGFVIPKYINCKY